MNIPIIINNRNLLTWPKAMVEKLKTMNNVEEIFIIDNESTYPPLLDWYETKPCEIIYLNNNMGHESPWNSGLVKKLNRKFYIVSDPDLGIDELPNDTIAYMLFKLLESPLSKLGLGLLWEYITENSLCYNHLQSYEKARWEKSKIKNEVYYDVKVDTTFALYNVNFYFIGGGSLKKPYVAKHYPWEFTFDQIQKNEEFLFYLKNANNSSSYKKYFNL